MKVGRTVWRKVMKTKRQEFSPVALIGASAVASTVTSVAMHRKDLEDSVAPSEALSIGGMATLLFALFWASFAAVWLVRSRANAAKK
jgi:hypothetical protein